VWPQAGRAGAHRRRERAARPLRQPHCRAAVGRRAADGAAARAARRGGDRARRAGTARGVPPSVRRHAGAVHGRPGALPASPLAFIAPPTDVVVPTVPLTLVPTPPRNRDPSPNPPPGTLVASAPGSASCANGARLAVPAGDPTPPEADATGASRYPVGLFSPAAAGRRGRAEPWPPTRPNPRFPSWPRLLPSAVPQDRFPLRLSRRPPRRRPSPGRRRVPPPVNEPVRSYAPGLARARVAEGTAHVMAHERLDMPLVIGGRDVPDRQPGAGGDAARPPPRARRLPQGVGGTHRRPRSTPLARRTGSGPSWAFEDRAAVMLKARNCSPPAGAIP